jgi:A/G-specific adenine glycosylase
MGLKKIEQSAFRAKLLAWHRKRNKRQMPWKGIRDPYRIWLSEVILQQTRVEQGREYYERFTERYPSVLDLAAAPDDEVFKLWEGLGYYSRCRNLLHSARFIAYELEGHFPSTFRDISALKGVGPYTAAAIASFAYGLPHAVVDGNVIRVLCRVFGISDPVEDTLTRKRIGVLADVLLDRESPAEYNQAIMDFGATVCKPRGALCTECPMSGECLAFRKGKVDQWPFKRAKPDKKKRFLHYILFERGGKVYVRKRDGRDIWKDLFEFYLVEEDRLLTPEELLKDSRVRRATGGHAELVRVSGVRKQLLSHQELTGVFFHVRLKNPGRGLEDHREVSLKALGSLAFPRFILSYLEENHVH